MNLNEKIFHFITETGLNVFYVPKEGYHKQHAIFATNFGSVDSTYKDYNNNIIEDPEGIAHFLEHALFEQPNKDIFDIFSELGADINAFTGFNQTAYLFSSTSNFYKCLEELIKFVQNPGWTDESIAKEKGIIEQEIMMYEDDPSWTVYFNCLNAMYNKHPLKQDIAGTVESIQKIDKEILLRTYNSFYHPKNMGLFIVGDLSLEKIKETVNKIEKKSFDSDWNVQSCIKESPGINNSVIKETMHTSNPLFYIGFKDHNLGLEASEEVHKEIVTDMLLEILFGSSSRFYNELFDEDLIDDNFFAFYSGKTTYGHSLIIGEAKDPLVVNNRIKKHISKSIDDIIKEEDFHRIKNDAIGNYIMGFNSIEFIAIQLMESFFLDFNMKDYLKVLSNVSFKDVKNRFKEHILEENMVISIVNPLEH